MEKYSLLREKSCTPVIRGFCSTTVCSFFLYESWNSRSGPSATCL